MARNALQKRRSEAFKTFAKEQGKTYEQIALELDPTKHVQLQRRIYSYTKKNGHLLPASLAIEIAKKFNIEASSLYFKLTPRERKALGEDPTNEIAEKRAKAAVLRASAKEIKKAMRTSGYSHRATAAMLHIGHATLSRYISGKHPVPDGFLERLKTTLAAGPMPVAQPEPLAPTTPAPAPTQAPVVTEAPSISNELTLSVVLARLGVSLEDTIHHTKDGLRGKHSRITQNGNGFVLNVDIPLPDAALKTLLAVVVGS